MFPDRKLLIVALLTLLAPGAQAAGVADRSDVQTFIGEMADKHRFDRQQLNALFGEVKLHDSIIAAISRPAESKPWHEYRQIFMTESRIDGGVAFWNRHADILAAAEEAYGVPPEIITAILGVETRYGRHAGSFRVIDALSTLAFGYPPRAPFFRGQLEHFLLMTRDEKISPLALKGSYAGAMGHPQFIPSSFRSYAVDFDQDGRRDLWENTHDVVGSVANYFKRHKWRPGEEVAHRARVSGERWREAVEMGIKPQLKAGDLADYGVEIRAELPPETPVAVLELEGSRGPEYWVVRDNFYVITRYNHSALYAMAVYQLSEAIKSAKAHR